MKFLKYGLAVVLIAVVALSVAGCSKEPLAAKVNGKKITVAEVDEKLQLQLKQLEQQYGGQHGEMFKGAEGEKIKNQLKQTILDQLIDMELILQEADKQGIKVTDKEVDKKIAEIMKSSNLKDQKALEEALKKTGMTLDKFKGEIDKVIRLEKLISKGLKVTDKDVEKYYNE
ncbi:MAG TPA: SurA N-terminal domain-containing protein, partial [Anaerolineae bacterium]|nr:SurA N-terminal domain-containing protein [Anaerolineae bacterium]